MAEIVILDDVRRALEIVRAREGERRWRGPRFRDIEYLDYFVLPPLCDREGHAFLKVEDALAMPWSSPWEEGPLALGEAWDFLVPSDMPVIPLFER